MRISQVIRLLAALIEIIGPRFISILLVPGLKKLKELIETSPNEFDDIALPIIDDLIAKLEA
jgi:hypothetical protein